MAKKKAGEPNLDHILPDLRPLAVPVSSIATDPRNARKHGQRDIQSTAASLKRYGQRKPLVVNTNGMVAEAGNGTLEAAKLLGWTHIAIVRADDDEATAMGYALADNRTAELSAWDYEQLGTNMQTLVSHGIELTELGWEPYEYEPLVVSQWAPEAIEHPPEVPRNEKGHVVSFTPEQWGVVEKALERAKHRSGKLTKPAELLTFIAQEFLS